MKKLLLALLAVLLLTGCSSAPAEKTDEELMAEGWVKQEPTDVPVSSNNDTNVDADQKATPIPNTDDKLSFGSTVYLGGFELTISDEVSFVTIENQFSEKDGADVIKIKASVKNVSGETGNINYYYINAFGPDGIELDMPSTYFDEAIGHDGELRDGAEKDCYIYIIYNGDGEYILEFDDRDTDYEVYLDISK